MVPFKAQNMSNHSAVTPDGGEIGRAQATQAAAAGVVPDRRMNPVLLKPSSDRRSHLVVLGEEVAVTDARSYGSTATDLRPVVLDALDSLRSDHRWLVAEGAGGAAEINLLDRDLVNLPLAHAAGIPAILVVDIDRGGAFASAYGSLALLPDHLRARVAGVVFNRFRGDPGLLDDGRRDFEARSGVPIIGVLPHLGGEPMLGLEDSLDLEAVTARGPTDTTSDRPVRVAVIRLPHMANPSDFDPLRVEPDVELHWAVRPSDLDRADLVVVPGSRATVEDLIWLRSRGLDQALVSCRADVVGICAGYQMLGQTIHDDIESGKGAVQGLGLLDVETRFTTPKIVRRSRGNSGHGAVEGYQIRLGRPEVHAGTWLELDDGPEGSADPTDRIRGTSLHGLFDSDGFRAGFLASVAERQGRHFTPSELAFSDVFDRHHDRLATWLGGHLDLDRLSETAETAAPPGEGPGW